MRYLKDKQQEQQQQKARPFFSFVL